MVIGGMRTGWEGKHLDLMMLSMTSPGLQWDPSSGLDLGKGLFFSFKNSLIHATSDGNPSYVLFSVKSATCTVGFLKKEIFPSYVPQTNIH